MFYNILNYNSIYFWNNSFFADIQPKSTRVSQSNGGDSRDEMDNIFDSIILSKNFTTSSDFYYMKVSYKTVGKNSNCYNYYVSNTSYSKEFSQNLRKVFFNFSDHLPIPIETESK